MHLYVALCKRGIRLQAYACPSAIMYQEFSQLCACAGCVQRASCLHLYLHLVGYHYTKDSRLSLPWKVFCEAVPIDKIMSLFDPLLYVTGAAGPLLCPLYHPGDGALYFLPENPDCTLQGMPGLTRPLASMRLTLWSLHCCWCA